MSTYADSVFDDMDFLEVKNCGCLGRPSSSRKPQFNDRQIDSSSMAERTNPKPQDGIEDFYNVNHKAPTTTSGTTERSDATTKGANALVPHLRAIAAIACGPSDCLAASDIAELTSTNISRFDQLGESSLVIPWNTEDGKVVWLRKVPGKSTRLTESTMSGWAPVPGHDNNVSLNGIGDWSGWAQGHKQPEASEYATQLLIDTE